LAEWLYWEEVSFCAVQVISAFDHLIVNIEYAEE
jgi:hypothetical protein